MRRLMMLLGVVALASCGDSRRDANGEEAVVDTSKGEMLEVPGDSVRLEDTLSDPPPSDSVR
jgi:hypothetical protein